MKKLNELQARRFNLLPRSSGVRTLISKRVVGAFCHPRFNLLPRSSGVRTEFRFERKFETTTVSISYLDRAESGQSCLRPNLILLFLQPTMFQSPTSIERSQDPINPFVTCYVTKFQSPTSIERSQDSSIFRGFGEVVKGGLGWPEPIVLGIQPLTHSYQNCRKCWFLRPPFCASEGGQIR